MILECFLAGRYFGPDLVWDSRRLSLCTCLIAALDIAFQLHVNTGRRKKLAEKIFSGIEVNNNLR